MPEYYGQNRTRAVVRAKILTRERCERFIVLRMRGQWAVMPLRLFVGVVAA